MKCVTYIAVLLIAGAASCNKSDDFLDRRTVEPLTETTTFADSARSSDFLTAIYLDSWGSFNPSAYRQAGTHGGCDEANVGRDPSNINLIYNLVTGGLNSVNVLNQGEVPMWRSSYANIRRVNLMLKNIDRIPVDNTLKLRFKGELRFLRAWYYFLMLKFYGGVPLIGDRLYSGEDEITGKRNTFAETVDYINGECDTTAAILPLAYTGIDYGRATKGMCLALKSRLLLYAASPLFNGGSIATDAQLKAVTSYPTYDASRWQLAADAAEAVINLGIYNLIDVQTPKAGYGFYMVSVTRYTGQTEIIFPYLQANNRTLEGLWRPTSRGGSRPSALPFQELVDAFGMKNGRQITEVGSGYDANNPYVNRDPRLEYTVAYNGSLMYDNTTRTQTPINTTFLAQPDGYGVSQPYTGYYINKMLGETTTATLNGADHTYPLIRYAEILLNAAEAINEASGPTARVYTLLELIRKRAGLNPFTLPTGLTKDQMRLRIQNERQVELAFEEHRFWDIRRWKIAEVTENKWMTGMKITPRQGGGFNYEKVNVFQHFFFPNMYLFPIPLSEVIKSSDLLQNPGW